MKLKELLKKYMDLKKFVWVIIGVFLTVILTPLFVESVVYVGTISKFINVPEVNSEELNIEVRRHIEMEMACIDKGNFFGEKWKETYQVYGILIQNKSDRLIEDFTLRIRLPGKIICHEEGGATELNFLIRPINIMAFDESGRINTEKLPLRLIYIPKFPLGRSLFFDILIDTEEDPEVEAILSSKVFKENIKIEEGTYYGDYQWNVLGKRIKETFSGTIEPVQTEE